MELDSMKEEIRLYILSAILPGEKPSNLHYDTPLRTIGIVDSTSMLEIVSFVERRYGIDVEAYEASVENFDRIEDIAAFVQRKQGATR